MKIEIDALITTRDAVEGIDSVISCISLAVTARPLKTNEMDGVLAILQWTGQRLADCSQDLGAVIDQLGSMPN